MKNLTKLLLTLGISLLSLNNAKAQASDSENFNFEKCISNIPYESISPEFVDYQKNNPDTIRYHYYPDKVKSNIFYRDVYLNIDEDPRVDVIETEAFDKGENGELVEKYEHPLGYAFFSGPQDMHSREVRDFHLNGSDGPDGLNGNEKSLEKIKECFYGDKESVLSRE